MNQRTTGIIIAVLAVVLVVFGIFQLGSRQRTTKSPTTSPRATPTPKPITLLDYLDSDDATVQFTIDGRIVAKENHFSQTISIGKNRRSIDIIKGYSGVAEPHQDYDNNQPAFEEFMRALQNAGFTKSIKNPKAPSTELGLCPFGQRYTYELIVEGSTLIHAWSTSCGDPTNFAGTTGTIRTLFQTQIPDFGKIHKL